MEFSTYCHVTKISQLCLIFQTIKAIIFNFIFLLFRNDFWYLIKSFDHLTVNDFLLK